ncbi:FAD-binding dehydrogenase [Aestuariirhabdus litorea]|uniref:FAD-binding dehydrogenase n=1 Tax=Aestuariirhabdus litorea TaxID=2528527 RepID=A0A3P3VIA6_9GAMM|nr:FAD-binding dehydrogenase [Aestuariirhabdus litorea]RRJ82471.1 FAD-binding dehydrogenase [Aestuariirhabdus litorea]RWW92632.1 FAD-binding dehydrogenase [Endozoicomonadaceae bacterium GTF-13]
MTTRSCHTLIIGGGIAGIVTALELLELNRPLVLVDRDTPERLGGLARWAFGGMALVDTPEQRRMKIADSPELALQDWHSFANFDDCDHWPKAWAQHYTEHCLERVYHWLRSRGLKFFPAVNWVERGLYHPGNSVPRYHVLWGTGWHLAETLIQQLRQHPNADQLQILHQHRVSELLCSEQERGCTGINEADGSTFRVRAEQVVVATGGINGSVERVKQNWYRPWGEPPAEILNGAHPFADGTLHDCVSALGGRLTHLDKMWNYAAGIPHPQPHFAGHGLSLIPCKSALWLDHRGDRIGPEPLVTGFDTNYLCQRVSQQEKPWTWQLLNWRIAAREFAISGSEHNVKIRDRKLFAFLKETLLGNHRLVRQMQEQSDHFLVADSLPELVTQMNRLTDQPYIDPHRLDALVSHYDAGITRGSALFNDDQLRRIEHARKWRSDRVRTCKPRPLRDPSSGPLIAIKLNLISRKSLGGIQTDLSSRVLDGQGEAIPGLFAVGEAAGFGGGGASGFRSLEGTFLSGCILTARNAAQQILQDP